MVALIMMPEYQRAQDDTIELIAARAANMPTEYRERFNTLQQYEFGRQTLFARLMKMYRDENSISRRQLEEQLEEGTFWERFLYFLANIDWDEVFNFVVKIVDLILKIIAVVPVSLLVAAFVVFAATHLI